MRSFDELRAAMDKTERIRRVADLKFLDALRLGIEKRISEPWPEPGLDWTAEDWIKVMPPASIAFTLRTDDTLST